MSEQADPWEIIREGLRAFKRYSDHKMSCYAWGPGTAFRSCTCGLVDVVEGAERALAAHDAPPTLPEARED